MTKLERLKAARELLSDKSKWVKDCYALSKHGDEVKSNDPEAECFCVLGGCHLDVDDDDDLVEILWKAVPEFFRSDRYALLMSTGVAGYNDHPDTTHADILALLDRGIAGEEN